MADVSLSTVRGQPRKKILTLTASNAAVAIPSWAQGGKALAYVTACAGGGGGGVRATSGSRGGGGAASGGVVRIPLLIPSGITTFAVEIGAGGAGLNANVPATGTPGGATTLTFGAVEVLRVAGAYSGNGSAAAGTGSTSIVLNGQVNVITLGMRPSSGTQFSSTQTYLIGNLPGGVGSDANAGYGAGASSLWGCGGSGIAAAPTDNTAGESGQGYGSGGAGALWLSGGAVKAGDGAPGFLQIEFVEGF